MAKSQSNSITPEDLAELAEELGSPSRRVRVDVRPIDGVGAFLRVDPRSGGEVAVQLMPNIYYPTPLRAATWRRLARLGWNNTIPQERVFEDDPRAILECCADTLTALGCDDVIAFTGEYAVDYVPQLRHALTFWDWKEDTPFHEFNRACAALIDSGAKWIAFTQADTGGDTYAVVIAERELSWEEADAAWQVYSAEIPNAGGELVVMIPEAGSSGLGRIL